MSKRTVKRAPAAPDPTTPDPSGTAETADDLPGMAPNTSAACPPGADALDRVRAALATAGPDGVTAAHLAETAHVARSTVSKLLVTLTKTGATRREAGGFIGRARQPDRWFPALSTCGDAASSPAAETPKPGASAPTPAIALAPTSGNTANGTATYGTSVAVTNAAESNAGAGGEPDSAYDAGPSAPAAPDTPTPPGRAASGPDTAPLSPTIPAPAAASDPSEGTPARLGQGALRRMVFEHLTTHPGQAFTPGEIGRILGRSSGAVANACDKLTTDGHVDLACEKPRRFRVTATAMKAEGLAPAAVGSEQPIPH